jgi:Fic family protein
MPQKNINPPFEITPAIFKISGEILQHVGQLQGLRGTRPQPKLRKKSKIRTIHDSLAIEGNSLSIEQVTAIIENKRVIGPKTEIVEVQNAIKAYEALTSYHPKKEADFLKAHKILMSNLTKDAGKYRSSNVGVFKGSQVAHVAPQPKRVPELMKNLFTFMKEDADTIDLIKSCIFHYEVEFIHPFTDGNGRVGRLWQHVLLYQIEPAFEFIPMESLIYRNQDLYYKVLGECDKKGKSTAFIEFSLSTILAGLKDYTQDLAPKPVSINDRLQAAKIHFNTKIFSRKNYITYFKTISSATASRDLKYGVQKILLKKVGVKSTSRYVFLKK